MPAGTKAIRLMEIGMEAEEDTSWDKIAKDRDRKESTFHTHSEVFGE